MEDVMPDDRFRVLLVEDNDDDAALVSQYINELGDDEFVLERACTLAAALQAMRQHTHDVILLDLGLPDSLGGIETIRAICEDYGDTSPLVVVLSGLDDDQIVGAAMKDCVQNYLVKGEIADHPQSLLRAIRVAVERHGIRRIEEIRRNPTPHPAAMQEAEQVLRRVGRVAGNPAIMSVEPGDMTAAVMGGAAEVILVGITHRLDEITRGHREFRSAIAEIDIWRKRIDRDLLVILPKLMAGQKRMQGLIRLVEGGAKDRNTSLVARVDALEGEERRERDREERRRKTIGEITTPLVSKVLEWLLVAIGSAVLWYILQRFGKK
jgi:CheY-like chemotaxis protein